MRELKAMDEQVIKVMPAPPNPVQKEALSRLSRGPVAYLCADRAQGVLIGSAFIWIVEGRGPELLERLGRFAQRVRQSLDEVAAP